jgi:type I restriction enzyme M protein
MTDGFRDIEKLEADLWEAADNLRANSKLTSSDYFMPVLGIIFLRHAANRFEAASRQIEADQKAGKMPKRPPVNADYISRRALWLPEQGRYDFIMDKATVSGSDLPKLVTEAMSAIEDEFEPLQGVLPKDYGIFEPKVLEDLMRVFNSQLIKQASGDVFGRIYEYFLAKFSVQKAHDNGEFFTPSSLVQLIVNVIEPDHGTVFDPANGSGGMFVQSSHFIEHEGEDTAKKVVFYGQEKNPTTIRIAKMNLAVHGLDGKIAEAITYYQDEHTLVGRCDFVMANPPFNVDLVDAERIAKDPRLPFGLPGVNKAKKVSNGNYLWISYFWSYLNEKGRSGFVMSSQASSAGHGEKEVRKKIIRTGDVDVMISIRQNFFYTRSVPCELWFFDRNKPEDRRDKVLMVDARNIYRKVTRKIYDFSPEQMQNLSSIVWLYRGERDRFLNLVKPYLASVCEESRAIPSKIEGFEKTLAESRERIAALVKTVEEDTTLDAEKKKALVDVMNELAEAEKPYEADRSKLMDGLARFLERYAKALPVANDEQHSARKAFDPTAEEIKGLIKQIDLLYKLTARATDLACDFSRPSGESQGDGEKIFDTRTARRFLKQLDEERKSAVEQLKQTAYFHRQIVWLQDRFPAAALQWVPGLVKLVDLKDIEAADWSLTPGRYVGVAPPEEDEDFDFEQTLRDIHTELADLNKEAMELAAKIKENFEELGA